MSTELWGEELEDEDGEPTDDAADVEVAGSRVAVFTPEPDVQLARSAQAMASAAVITADLRPTMKAPRDAADTLSDCGRLERARFITEGQEVNQALTTPSKSEKLHEPTLAGP